MRVIGWKGVGRGIGVGVSGVRCIWAHTWVRPYGVYRMCGGFGVSGGERVDRRLWRRKGDERVAAVEKIED